MFYENNQTNEYDFNECSSKGSCSISPNVSAIQEIVLILIREIAYYLKKLKRLSHEFNEIETEILQALSEFVFVAEYTDDEVLITLKRLNSNLITLQRKYLSICKKKNISCSSLTPIIKLDNITKLSTVITMGEKLYIKRTNKLNNEEKLLSEIMLLCLKSLATNTLKLNDYNVDTKNPTNLIINSLNLYNFTNLPQRKLEKTINDICETESNILLQRANLQLKTFGEIKETKVSTSTRKNKAILVSGSCLTDLYNFLSKCQNEKNLDIYSHGDLLIAHAFEKFKEFPNFIGHWGTSNENCIFDFATFPGPILLTKHSKQNLENLIRGRIYTMDKIQPKGVVKISENEFDKIIECAKITDGFIQNKTKNEIVAGYDNKYIEKQITTISQKIKTEEIERLLIIGMSGKSTIQEIYLNNIIKNLSNKTFIINFSEITTDKAHLEINIADNFPIMYHMIKKISNNIKLDSNQISFYLQKCDPNSISGIIQLKNLGVKKILLASCSPTRINPLIMNSLTEKYDLRITTTPQIDADFLEN